MAEDKAEAEVADLDESPHDISHFEMDTSEPITVKRNVTISVRFSAEELAELRARAEKEDLKVTSFIRAAALEASSPVDRTLLGDLARELERRAHDVATLVAKGA